MEYWDMPADWSEEYLQTFEPVLHSVLRGYHVSNTNSEYQDLLQLGRILILETFQIRRESSGRATLYLRSVY